MDLGPVLGGAGIVGIALAFALKDTAENDICWILMGLRNPFSPGHQIVSGSRGEGTAGARRGPARVEGVNEDPAPEAWVEELAASGVTLWLRFSHGPRDADVWGRVQRGAHRRGRRERHRHLFERAGVQLARG